MKRAALPLIGIAVLYAAMGAVVPHLRDAGEERGLSFIVAHWRTLLFLPQQGSACRVLGAI